MLTRSMLRHGTNLPPPARRMLRAGPLSLAFEAGGLRYIRLGDREVLRAIYVAVRDRNWRTVPAVVSDLQADVDQPSFLLTFRAEHREGAVDFSWRGRVFGELDGTLTFTMDGAARSTFLRNRIGFCVLHPASCAGAPVTIEHADGSDEEGAFPRAIAPRQPFRDVRGLRWEVEPGIAAEVRFEGDVFETEDQRNWTDASFKTYSTPLDLPFPVRIHAGDPVRQTVTVGLQRALGHAYPAARPPRGDADVRICVDPGRRALPLPGVGLGCATGEQTPGEREAARLRSLRLSHVRADVRLDAPNLEDLLARAADEAAAAGAPLELAATLTGSTSSAELKRIRAAVGARPLPLCRWLVFHAAEKTTTARTLEAARRVLSDLGAGTPFVAGTDAYFAELNRFHAPVETADGACYSANPQGHTFDDESLMETLEVQATTVESARRFCAGLPIHVTPVTLLPRHNPDATAPIGRPGDLSVLRADPRQMSLLGAAWTLGSLKYLAEAGCASVTYHETIGPRGVMGAASGPGGPAALAALSRAVYPMYHVLADVGEAAGRQVLPTVSAQPLRAVALCLEGVSGRRWLVANLTARRVSALLEIGRPAAVRLLDEASAEAAMREPEAFRASPGERLSPIDGTLRLEMLPYAVARVDEGEPGRNPDEAHQT